MAFNKGIWDSKPRGTNIKGTNLKSLRKRHPQISETLSPYNYSISTKITAQSFHEGLPSAVPGMCRRVQGSFMFIVLPCA